MRVGVQFVRQSPRMRAVLWRISVFFLHATAPHGPAAAGGQGAGGRRRGHLHAAAGQHGRGRHRGRAVLPRLRQAMPRDALVLRGTLVQPPPPA